MAQATQGTAVRQMASPAESVERYMERFLDGRALPGNLREAIRYGAMGGGKRLRPTLVVRCCEAVGGDGEAALPPAAAIEFIHCFSLIHDDLPAMDDDDLRRGRPTLHRHTSEAMAILAGDAMNTLAFELLVTRIDMPALAAGLVRELALATDDMIAGQVYDTLPDFPADADDHTRLTTIHHHKTGALIRCACRMGAMAGGAEEAELDALTRYGQAIGLMFQVVDDILDVTQSTEHLGKTANKDVQQGKITYPAVLGMEASRREVTRLHGEALATLESLGAAAGPLRELCDYMATRSR